MLTISFNRNKDLFNIFTDITLSDIVSVAFGLIRHFSGIQNCSLSYAYCFLIPTPAHTHRPFRSVNSVPLCHHKGKYTDKANPMRKNIFNPSFLYLDPDDVKVQCKRKNSLVHTDLFGSTLIREGRADLHQCSQAFGWGPGDVSH